MIGPDPVEIPIEQNLAAHRFEARFPEGLALLKYHYDDVGRLHLDHTEVPAARRHQGVAARLARAALEFARARKATIVPLCPYVITYLKKHPEYAPLVDPGATG